MSNLPTTVSADQSKNLRFKFRKGEGRTITFQFLEGTADFDISPYTFVFQVFEIDSATPIFQLTQGAGLTNGGVTGILTVDPTDNDVDLDEKTYDWRLKITSPAKETWFNGLFQINNSPQEATDSDNATVNLDLGDIVINVDLAIGVTSADLEAEVTLDFPLTPVGASISFQVSVPGAALSDPVTLGIPDSSVSVGVWTAHVSNPNEVNINFKNVSDIPTNPGPGIFKILVHKNITSQTSSILGLKTVDTGGSVIILDMTGQIESMFESSDPIGLAKAISFANDTKALFIPSFTFNLSSIVALTWPTNVKMEDIRYNPTTKVWTPADTGNYEMSATHNTNTDIWNVKIGESLL